MIDSPLSYYNSEHPWKHFGEEFLIRGFALHEQMPPMTVKNGDKSSYPWPWLLIYFESPVILNEKSCTEIPAGTLMVWPPGATHCYGNPERGWSHSWMIVDLPEMESVLGK